MSLLHLNMMERNAIAFVLGVLVSKEYLSVKRFGSRRELIDLEHCAAGCWNSSANVGSLLPRDRLRGRTRVGVSFRRELRREGPEGIAFRVVTSSRSSCLSRCSCLDLGLELRNREAGGPLSSSESESSS